MTSFLQGLNIYNSSSGKKNAPDTLLRRLEKNVSYTPDKQALTFLGPGPNGGAIEAKMTYKDVWDETGALAENLLASGIKKGEMAVLVYPPSLDFIIAFIACLRAGIVAVPVFPPQPSRKDTLLMFSTIVASCNAKYALTNSMYSHLKKLTSLKDSFRNLGRGSSPWPEDLKWFVTDSMSSSVSKKKKSQLSMVEISPADLAFLQYTSGSTSEPKGVMISHHNLADNLTKITSSLKAVDDTIVVSWLPQYHDMGLIGSYLGSLYCGGSGYYMSPFTFLQRPVMWVEAISRFRATHIQAPNFAFKLTARKFDASKYTKDTLDLSSIRHMINAAEPVTEDSINSFNTAFVPFGLKKETMFPTYGLAEHTVFVCSNGLQKLTVSKHSLEVDGRVVEVSDKGQSNDSISKMIGCGMPLEQNVDVKIVSTVTLEALDEDLVGEIWLRSGSKAGGYYLKPDITKRDFFAQIGVDPDSHQEIETDGYLRTGDLGFLHNKELFVCGRLKDLIIVGGRNYYPQDLEATAEAIDNRFRPGCSAAFTIDPISGGDEQVAMVLELREIPSSENRGKECDQLVEKLRGALTQEHSLSVSHIVLLQPKTVPKTSSGKIARARCRKSFLDKSLQAVYAKSFQGKVSMEIESSGKNNSDNVAPPMTKVDSETIRKLSKKQILKKLLEDISKYVPLPPERLPKDDDLSTMMDSLTLSQFKGLLEYEYATNISDGYLFRSGTSINKLVDIIKLGYAPDDGDNVADFRDHMAVGKSKGLAGALGCPPGVRCVIM